MPPALDTLLTFLRTPLTSADAVLARFATLPGAIARGTTPRRFVLVPGTRSDRVLLVAHADTVWDDPDAGHHVPTELDIEDGVIRATTGGLGADDRAGCAILWLLRHLGHSLLVTDGEERGRLGAQQLMADPALAELVNTHHFAVQFDRRGRRDFKCYDVGTDEFRAYVAGQTGYTEPDRRSFTDICTLCGVIPGVNLSVGYSNEHTDEEKLVVRHWRHTLALARRWLGPAPLPRFAGPRAG
ncbi:MAG: M28 family peptidase [Gemmatimonadales bacterium]|nr:M28 family peptidase [Gemmatimonadales bacterium]